MNHTYSDKKSVSYISSVALLVYSVGALIGSILCVAAKKKTTASIFFALSGVTAAMGGLVMYTLRAQDRSVKFRCPGGLFRELWMICVMHMSLISSRNMMRMNLRISMLFLLTTQ